MTAASLDSRIDVLEAAPAGDAVDSVNGLTGDVVLTSDNIFGLVRQGLTNLRPGLVSIGAHAQMLGSSSGYTSDGTATGGNSRIKHRSSAPSTRSR